MEIRYTYVWNIGQNYHRVEIFSFYTKENGLLNKISEIENTLASEILKFLRQNNLPKEQIKMVHDLMKMKSDGIITSDLKYFNN